MSNLFNSLINQPMVVGIAHPGQYGFQPAYSPIMEGIIDLHNYICFFLVAILIFVSWMLFYTIYLYRYDVRLMIYKNKSTFLSSYLNDLSKTYKPLYPVRKFFASTLFSLLQPVDYKETKKLAHWTSLEVAWTILPSFILLAIAVPSFILLYSMDELTDDISITVKVIGHQWYWTYQFTDPSLFNYVSDIDPNKFTYDSYMIPWESRGLEESKSLLPEFTLLKLKNLSSLRLLEVDKPLWLPVKTHIRFMITAADVIHCFAIPALGVKVDAVPGRLNQTFVYINQPGLYFGQCSEICGANHGFMPIEIVAVPWEHWSKFFENGFKNS